MISLCVMLSLETFLHSEFSNSGSFGEPPGKPLGVLPGIRLTVRGQSMGCGESNWCSICPFSSFNLMFWKNSEFQLLLEPLEGKVGDGNGVWFDGSYSVEPQSYVQNNLRIDETQLMEAPHFILGRCRTLVY
jgi:hypothetical protein